MTPDQRSEFERRLIIKAFEAGVVGRPMDGALCEVADEMGIGDALSWEDARPTIEKLFAADILRQEGEIPEDWLALSFEEWGKYLSDGADAPFAAGCRANFGRWVAAMLRGRGTP